LSRFEYAPAPESRAIVDIKSSYGLFINGVFTDATDGKPFKSVSPASEEVLAEVSEAGPADVDRAVKAARKAFDRSWGTMPGRDRAKYLYRIAPRTSSTTPAGPTSFPMRAWARTRGRSVSPVR
jgi:hypothetical protein